MRDMLAHQREPNQDRGGIEMPAGRSAKGRSAAEKQVAGGRSATVKAVGKKAYLDLVQDSNRSIDEVDANLDEKIEFRVDRGRRAQTVH